MAGVSRIIGLDLGQVSDYSALSIIERDERPAPLTSRLSDPDRKNNHLAVRHLQRWRLGTGYPQIVKDTVELMDRPQLTDAKLVIDWTGVGRPVVDLFRQEEGLKNRLIPVSITAGSTVSRVLGGYHVAKKHLVGVLQVLLQSRRLVIAPALELAQILLRELSTFKVKVTSTGHEDLSAWRTRDHDDLVLSVALACWYAEKVSNRGPLLRILPTTQSNKSLTVAVVSYEELPSLETYDKALLIYLSDHPPLSREEFPDHHLASLLDSFRFQVCPVIPQDHQDTWETLVPPYNKLCRDLLLTPLEAKSLWAFLLKKRDPNPTLLVVAGENSLPLTVAQGITDGLFLPRRIIYCGDGFSDPKEEPTNQHVYQTVRAGRSKVI